MDMVDEADGDGSVDEVRSLIKNCLRKQLDELEMLTSIYCNPGELKIDDHSIAADINEFLENRLSDLNRQLDYTITLEHRTSKIYVTFQLPHLYPCLELANISVRSSLFSKTDENSLKKSLMDFTETLDKSEVYSFEVLTWIQDNVDKFIGTEANQTKSDNKQFIEFERMWIYSHHLKSKTKRQEIVKSARQLDLSGFSRPGKPGIICVEGWKKNTEEFWKYIRSMNWQKITIRKSELKTICLEDLNTKRKFSNFNEQLFVQDGDEQQEVQMDMSLFMKFLEKHNCSYIRKNLFGFDMQLVHSQRSPYAGSLNRFQSQANNVPASPAFVETQPRSIDSTTFQPTQTTTIKQPESTTFQPTILLPKYLVDLELPSNPVAVEVPKLLQRTWNLEPWNGLGTLNLVLFHWQEAEAYEGGASGDTLISATSSPFSSIPKGAPNAKSPMMSNAR
ncbi:RWD domain-containing protein 2A [Pseudolycoriella hygida]|uniref:RWD domain-containing protein 2A n=1 Tax=Pseudolycoriella hygida TaxID=35572 RepID=A0A9Q0RVP2_9DIPT|nr:RWD domain-containing protein 2A [Pseudolycoriella hygida]